MKDDKAMKIQPTRHDDIPALQDVLTETGLFPADMLPGMLDGFLSDYPCADLWLTAEVDGRPVGFCYATPEALTDGTWNMLAIAVLPSEQGNGRGGAIVRYLEQELSSRHQRILIADTSGTEAFAQTRAFYRKNGYAEEARIRDFWGAGDDKIVFWKALD